MQVKAAVAAGAAILAALLIGWALIERSGRFVALAKVKELEAALELCNERIRESNRAVTALSAATTAANARAEALAKLRTESNAPLVASIRSLEERIASAAASQKTCSDALREAREEVYGR